MLDVYLFNAMFVLQIVLISVLIPRRLLQRACENLARNPPDPRSMEAVNRTLGRFRLANNVIAALGLIVMALIYAYMRQPGWDEDPVPIWQTLYYLLQFAPIAVLGFIAMYINKTLRASLANEKRRAVLQRRGLFDFISPLTVMLTLACYPLVIGLGFYVDRHPFVMTGVVSLVYAIPAFMIHRIVHGRKSSPLQTHDQHLQEISTGVRILVFSVLIAALSIMVNLSMVVLDTEKLVPLVVATAFVAVAMWIFMNMKAAPCAPAADAVQPGTAH